VVRRSLRPIGVLSIVVCAAAGIAGAGTLLLSRNSVSSLPWYAQPQQSTETEEAIESSASKAALMPATVKPPTITSRSSNQQPSPEERVELVKRGHALLKAEATAAQSNIETPPVAVPPTSATQEVAPSATATVPAPNNETAENLAASTSGQWRVLRFRRCSKKPPQRRSAHGLRIEGEDERNLRPVRLCFDPRSPAHRMTHTANGPTIWLAVHSTNGPRLPGGSSCDTNPKASRRSN